MRLAASWAALEEPGVETTLCVVWELTDAVECCPPTPVSGMAICVKRLEFWGLIAM